MAIVGEVGQGVGFGGGRELVLIESLKSECARCDSVVKNGLDGFVHMVQRNRLILLDGGKPMEGLLTAGMQIANSLGLAKKAYEQAFGASRRVILVIRLVSAMGFCVAPLLTSLLSIVPLALRACKQDGWGGAA